MGQTTEATLTYNEDDELYVIHDDLGTATRSTFEAAVGVYAFRIDAERFHDADKMDHETCIRAVEIARQLFSPIAYDQTMGHRRSAEIGCKTKDPRVLLQSVLVSRGKLAFRRRLAGETRCDETMGISAAVDAGGIFYMLTIMATKGEILRVDNEAHGRVTFYPRPRVGMGATLNFPRDCYPYEVVRVSPSGKTCHVRRLDVVSDPAWKADFTPGGFCGHIHNLRSQRHLFLRSSGTDAVRHLRLTKRGWASKGTPFTVGSAHYFVDRND